MSNKRVIIIFSIVLFLVLIIILASTLFNLKTVEITFTNEAEGNVDNESLQNVMKKYEGKNLLFLSKDEVAEEVEKSNPYIGTIVVEKVFPTTIRLHIEKREEVFAIQLLDDSNNVKYYMLDANGYVLRVGESITDNTIELTNNILISGIASNEVTSKTVGKRLQLTSTEKLSCVLDIAKTLLSLDDSLSYTVYGLKTFITEINVADSNDVIIKTSNGVKISLYSSTENVVNQMRFAIGVFNTLSDSKRGVGTISIIRDKSTEIGCNGFHSIEN